MLSRTPLLMLAAVLVCATAQAQDRELSSHESAPGRHRRHRHDGVVLKSELRVEMDRIEKRLKAQGTTIPPERNLAQQVLERLVISQIQLQRADRVGIKVSDETLNNALANIAQRNNVSLDQLPGVLAAEGLDYQTYRAKCPTRLRSNSYASATSTSGSRRGKSTSTRAAGRRAAPNQEFDLSQILVAVSPTATPDAIAAAEKKINDLYERVKAGEDFAQLAVSYSDGQQALEGGALGWRKGDELPTVFADVVPGLEKGQVSEPIRSASGFHLVRLNDLRGGEPIMEKQIHVRHILITPNEVLDDDGAQERIKAVRERIVAGDDDFGSVAKAISDDTGSKAEGGDLGWSGPGVFAPEFSRSATGSRRRRQRAVQVALRVAYRRGAWTPGAGYD